MPGYMFFTLRTPDNLQWIIGGQGGSARLAKVGGASPPPTLYQSYSTATNAKAQLERSIGKSLVIVPIAIQQSN